MDLIADGLLICGAIAATFYCWVLSVRVRSLKDLDGGLGGAIAGLSRQVDEMQTTLKAAKAFSDSSRTELDQLAKRAERAAAQLRDLLEEADASTGKPRKQPSLKALRQAEPEQKPDPSPKQTRAVEPRLEDVAETTQDVEDPGITLAQQLQRDIRKRITGRDDVGDRDDFVRALQDILAASK